MGLCPYCNQAEISERSQASIWVDFLAKALSQVRVFFEIREQPDFNMKRLFKAYVDSDTLPLPTKQDRLCPLCRRGHVTKRSIEAIWPDLAVRLMGMGRTYLELRGDKEGFPIQELAFTIVEGDAATIPTDNSFNDIKVEVVDDPDEDEDTVDAEAVDSTPFDDDQELFRNRHRNGFDNLEGY